MVLGFALMRQYLLGLLLLGYCVNVESRSRRWRRQVLPSQHVQVQSFDTNVMYNNNDIYVESTENRIDLKERTVNGSVWSDHSLLHFDSLDSFANITADNAESYLTIANGAVIHGQSIKSDIYLHSNRTQGGNSAISQSLSGSANFTIEDEALRVQAVNGRKISIEAETWQRSVQSKMTLNAEASGNGTRELRFEAIGPMYHVLATYAGSTMFVTFADKIIRLDGDYRDVEIFTDKFNVTVIIRNEPYDVTLTQEEVIINLPTQRTRVCVTLDGVSVKSNQVAKTHIEKNDATMIVGGEKVQENGATLIAATTSLELNNAGQITADLTNSRFIVDNNVQKIGLVSAHNTFIIDQGYPNITVDPGDSCVIILGNRGLPNFTDVIPPFEWPEDKFQEIGPFGGNQEAEIEFLNKPSCCYFGPQTGSGTWSEWGNNGNNGGWNTAGGQGTTTRQRGTTSSSTRRPGIITTHAPEFGRWPTFSPEEDEFVNRKEWPETFNTGSTSSPRNWEDKTGCNCHSNLPSSNTRPTTLLPDFGITTTVREMSIATTTESDFPEPAESSDGEFPSIEPDTDSALVSTEETPEVTEATTKIFWEETTLIEEVTAEGFPTPVEPEAPTRPEEPTAPIETSETSLTQNEERTTTEVFPDPNLFPTLVGETEEGSTASILPTDEDDDMPTAPPLPSDWAFAQYPSTLSTGEVELLATVVTIAVDGDNVSADGFPPPSRIHIIEPSTTEPTTEENTWDGGASDVEDISTDEPSADDFPQPLLNDTSLALPLMRRSRTPLMLTLRLPENVVGKKIDPFSIRESLRRVIRKAAHHKIAKREIVEDEDLKDLINIESIQERNGNLEIIFNMVGNETIDEKELLSLSNKEMSQYFEFPVVSLTKLGVEYGDSRLLYILVSLGLAVMSLFCLCCLFQTIIKRMSDALLVNIGKRFHKHAPGDIPQYQNSVAPC